MSLYSISGTHCSGKTTLINLLGEKYLTIPEQCRFVEGFGFQMISKEQNETQLAMTGAILSSHLKHSIENPYIYTFTDRCLLDVLAYSKYALLKGDIDEKVFNFINRIFWVNQNIYEKIFITKPEFNIEDDGFRSIDKDYQLKIDQIFEQIIEEYKLPNIIRLTGSVEERLKTITDNIKD